MMDIDSTVQEGNISYPSDANLMTKLCGTAAKVVDFLKGKTRGLRLENLSIDLKAIRSKAREYWFAPKSKARDIKNAIFQELHHLVKQQMRPVVDICESLDQSRIRRRKRPNFSVRTAVV